MIQAAKDALAAKDSEIVANQNAIADLTVALAESDKLVNEDTDALHAWYHNPFILIPMGVLVGGITAGYLLRK